ncbi:hypothetical protein BKA58DRAFT_315730 [Alternaria rosae]|uniref:uncharacterized protein n=1 Tax=Alternaria rosae TaxID=1187941 RepID=UPI001E8E6A6A|nr:uncharacterized protein BKA58DRAFT_315730 [Alternaria rosae]KAH6869955.1 hypothetical protein BKA58DRAFT_315730 [Alternaria rosae]
MAVLGVVLDAVIWCLPHYVVWHLKLRLSHKVAVSIIFAFGLFNMFIGAFRLDSLAGVAYQGDVTYGMGNTLMWAIARMSTAIIVACLPHLRPLFDCILPRRLIHLSTRRSKTRSKASQSRAGSIVVTTQIAVQPGSPQLLPPPPPSIDIVDGQLDPMGPIFHVEQGPAKRTKRVSYDCGGPSRGCGLPC